MLPHWVKKKGREKMEKAPGHCWDDAATMQLQCHHRYTPERLQPKGHETRVRHKLDDPNYSHSGKTKDDFCGDYEYGAASSSGDG